MEAIENIESLTVNKAGTAPKYTPFATLLKLKKLYPRISLRHLGKQVGISAEAVRTMFLRNGVNWEDGQPLALKEFKEMRADIFTIKQLEGLNALTPKKLHEAPVNHLTMMIEKLYACERLERGESTANVATSLTGLICKLSGNSRGLVNDPSTVLDAEIVPDSRGDADA